jgi:cell division protein FtsX
MIPLEKQVIELIKSLPNDCTLEDIQYHIYVREKVEGGIQAVDNGKFISQEKAEKQVNEWLDQLDRTHVK